MCYVSLFFFFFFFFFQAEDGIRDLYVTGVQTCALPILLSNTASHPCHSPPLRRDEQSHSRARTAAFWLGFTSDRKSSAPGLSGAFLIGTRHLLLCFPSGLPAHSHASATAGPYRFDHSRI